VEGLAEGRDQSIRTNDDRQFNRLLQGSRFGTGRLIDEQQIQAITEASEDISFEEMTRLQARAAEIVRQDPNVAYVSSFVGSPPFNPQQLNNGRMFIVLKPQGERDKIQKSH